MTLTTNHLLGEVTNTCWRDPQRKKSCCGEKMGSLLREEAFLNPFLSWNTVRKEKGSLLLALLPAAVRLDYLFPGHLGKE